MTPTPRTRRRGFTLIEMVGAMVVIATIAAGASAFIYRAASQFQVGATQAQLAAEVSAAMDRLDRELRDIAKKTGAGSVAPNISAVTASSITFGSSSFALSGTDLTVSENGAAPVTLMQDVTGFNIQAYDQSNAAMAASLTGAACNTIQRLGVTLTASRGGVSATLRTKIYLRCTISGASAG